jgi:hypothetical protein
VKGNASAQGEMIAIEYTFKNYTEHFLKSSPTSAKNRDKNLLNSLWARKA